MKKIDLRSIKKKLIKSDSSLFKLFDRHNLTYLEVHEGRSPYESLVRAIAHQQLHGKAAETILDRMLAMFPHKKFPSCDDILNMDFEKLKACGFSTNKVKSIRDIALKTQSGLVPSMKEIRKLSDGVLIERLTQIFGVGQWTVEMMLIFNLGRLDVWPSDDFGVRNGWRLWKRKREILSAKEIAPFGNKWIPYRTIVALHLWREADMKKLSKAGTL